MAFENCRLPIADYGLNPFARAARFAVGRSATGRIRHGELNAAFERPAISFQIVHGVVICGSQ